MKHLLDKILTVLKKSELNSEGLKHLESDVWARIEAQKADQPSGRLEGFLASLFPARHRIAPVMCAAVLGIVVGFGTFTPSNSPPDAAEMLNFKIFKPQISGLSPITLASERL
jgi:hypothetical protein